MTIGTAQAFGIANKLSPQAVRGHCRRGTFGKHAFRGPGGNWLIHMEEGRAALLRNRDLTTASLSLIADDAELRKAERARAAEAKRAAVAAPEVDLVEWSGPGGTYTAPASVARALEAAWANPDQPLMSPELIEACDRILVALGQLPKDFPIGCQVEVEPLNEVTPVAPERGTP